MKKIFLFFFFFVFAIPSFSQEGFEFVKTQSSRLKIPVKIINNLVFIPVKVNGVELLFLLDTGVEETILFTLDETKELSLNQVVKINIRGLGGNEAVEGLKSSGNLLEISKMQSKNHLLYMVLDTSFNLSSFVGVPVSGIIGSAAFKNFLVEIDYIKKVVYFYKLNSKYHQNITKKFSKVPLMIEKSKPYVYSKVMLDDTELVVKLLIDTGNSDAVWLFDHLSEKIYVPQNYFEDYLGQGLSGAIEGKRARISQFSIANYTFNSPIIAFPEAASIKNISLQSGRLGSLGGEILRRFLVVFDYTNSALYLKKNKQYSSSFYYNKSGIEIWNTGLQLVQQIVAVPDNSIVVLHEDSQSEKSNSKYRLVLKPVYEIGSIREDSNAARCGLQAGDILVAIDGKPAYNFSLQEVNAHLWSEDEIWITLRILREGKMLNFKFQLKNIL